MREKVMLEHKQLYAVVLAAGDSRRMGRCKQLQPWLDGQPIICALLDELCQLQLAKILVVAGRYADQLNAVLGDYPVTIIEHQPGATMLSSLQAGLRHVDNETQAIGALVLPSDLPRLKADLLQQIVAAYRPGRLVVPSYRGQSGHPVIFDRAGWRAVLALEPQQRPRAVLQAEQQRVWMVEVATDSIIDDIDTPAAYKQAYQRALAER